MRLGLGTDTGGVTGGQFFGLGSHVELELLVTKAGLTPMQAVALGTHTAAEILRLDELGMVGPGKSADFLVLDANPLDDIANTRKISASTSMALRSIAVRCKPNGRRCDRRAGTDPALVRAAIRGVYGCAVGVHGRRGGSQGAKVTASTRPEAEDRRGKTAPGRWRPARCHRGARGSR